MTGLQARDTVDPFNSSLTATDRNNAIINQQETVKADLRALVDWLLS